ncbi:MAG: sensitivity to high expression protein she9 [Cirrosporium novae-zelandiae]|nr:MAG: sensitivity to high expression protein she9 [Cirrosporium novae-zelandiae]
MQAVVRHASRSALEFVVTTPKPKASTSVPRLKLNSQFSSVRPSICHRCRIRASIRFYSNSHSLQDQSPSKETDRDALDSISGSALPSSPGSNNEHINNNSLSQKERNKLPSHTEGRRSQLSKRLTHLMDDLQTNIFFAGKKLNDLTGYSGIEALKHEIDILEKEVRHTRQVLRDSKADYSNAIATRSASQREVNELLQRKHAWSHQDLERFTELYRSDHANEQAESQAQEALAVAERAAEEAASRLSKTILARYHEEQIWSDKIRRMSTWGTWGLMGMNILLFLVFQLALEPWRRKRLVKGFEEKVVEALEKEGVVVQQAAATAAAAVAGISNPEPVTVAQTLESNPATPEPIVEPEPQPQPTAEKAEEAVKVETPLTVTETEFDVPLSESPPPAYTITFPEATPSIPPSKDPFAILKLRFESFKYNLQDLVSERTVVVRRLDITVAAIEGAAVGATVVGGLVWALIKGR